MAELVLDAVDELWVDAIHEPSVDVAGGVAEHVDDGGADREPDDGIGPIPPRQGADRGAEDGEGGEAVGASVELVGDQGSRADAAPGPDAVPGDDLVASEADEPGDRDQSRSIHGVGIDEPADGFPPGDER